MLAENVPRLETARLLLREWRDDDLDAFAAMSADPEVMRYLGGVLDRGDSWRRIALHAGHWALRGYGNWAVERKADGVLIGRVGLWNPEGWLGLEIGWKLARDAWGHGYATEAASAAIDWAWTTLRTPRLISVIDPRNVASVRVAERLGLRRLREEKLNGGPFDGVTVLIFAIEQG
jgi:RimJ/RimL family protein N-acetyltransferase